MAQQPEKLNLSEPIHSMIIWKFEQGSTQHFSSAFIKVPASSMMAVNFCLYFIRVVIVVLDLKKENKGKVHISWNCSELILKHIFLHIYLPLFQSWPLLQMNKEGSCCSSWLFLHFSAQKKNDSSHSFQLSLCCCCSYIASSFSTLLAI